jgi:hypothetical protein
MKQRSHLVSHYKRDKLLAGVVSLSLPSLQKENIHRDANQKNIQLFYLRTETDPASETSCFLFSRTPEDGKIPRTQ